MANTRSYPSGMRNFSVAINENKSAPVFNYIYDPTVVFNTPQGNAITGAWRTMKPSDLAANISLSGVSLSIGSVAVTGTTQTSIINPILPVSGVATLAPNSNVIINYTGGQAIAVSGNFGSASSTSSVVLTGNNSVNVNYTGASPLPVSGVVTVIGGAASSATTLITGSTLVLPVSGLVQFTNGTINTTLTGISNVNVNNAVTITYGGGPLVGISGSVTTTPTSIQAVSGLVVNNGGTVNVALTGTNNTTVINTVPVTFTGGALLGVSGSLTTTAPVIQAVSGIVTVIGGTTSSSTVLTGVNNVFVGYTGGNLVGVSGSLTVNPAPITPVSGLVTIVGGINSSSSTVLTGVNNVIVNYTGGSLLGVSGALSVAAAPLQAVSGLVTLVNPASSSVILTGINNVNVNFTGGSLIGVSGAFSATVGNVHETGTVNSLISYTGGSLVGVSGSLTVAAAPITPVSGIITVGNTVLVGYTGGNLLGVSGNLSVAAAPIQAVSGLITLVNPTSSNVVLTGSSNVNVGFTGGSLIGVSGALSISAAPLQAVSGLITLINPASASVVLTGSNSVSINNIPTVLVSGTNPIFVTGNFNNNYQTHETGVASVLVTNAITIANPVYAVNNTGGYVGITGTANTNVTNSVLAVSGIVTTAAAPLQAVSGLITLVNPASASVVLTGSNSVSITNTPTVIVSGTNPLYVTGNFGANYQTHETGVASVLVTNPVYSVSITGQPLAITGNFGLTGAINVTSVAITGNPIFVISGGYIGITGTTTTNISNPILAVSGIVTSAAAAITAVSGLVTVVNPAYTVGLSGSPAVIVTGGFIAITGTSNISVTGGSITVNNTSANPVLVSGGPVYQFGFNITGVTSGQFQIPVGAISYGWSVESGSAYVNNILINSPMSINGGGYASATILKTAINIGVTGGRVVATWEL